MLYFTLVTLKFYLLKSRIFNDTATTPFSSFIDSPSNITDPGFTSCVNYNSLLNHSSHEQFLSCTEEGRDNMVATVSSLEVDGDSVALEVDTGADGSYTCECRFSSITFLHEKHKYMVSSKISSFFMPLSKRFLPVVKHELQI